MEQSSNNLSLEVPTILPIYRYQYSGIIYEYTLSLDISGDSVFSVYTLSMYITGNSVSSVYTLSMNITGDYVTSVYTLSM